MNMQNDQPRFILTMEGPSARGQVAAVTQFLEQHGAYIEEFAVFDDVLTSRFYLRSQVRLRTGESSQAGELESALNECLAPLRGLAWQGLQPGKAGPGDHHGLQDRSLPQELLSQVHSANLNMEVKAVVSNHTLLEPLASAEAFPSITCRSRPTTSPGRKRPA